MITQAQKRRLEEAIPFTHDIDYIDDDGQLQEGQFTLTPYWSGQDIPDPQYPAIVFDWDSRGEPNENAESLNRLAGWESSEDESEVIIDREDPEIDVLSVTIATAKEFRDGIPAQARAGEITRKIWEWFKQDSASALNNEGPNGEAPMLPVPDSSPTPASVEDTFRLEFSLELRHTVTSEETQDAVDEMDAGVTLE